MDVENVKKGYKYDVTFTTVLIDLDNRESQKKLKTHSFYIRTDATNVDKCDIVDGLIVFSWNTVYGAEGYRLLVKDDILSEINLCDSHVVAADLSKDAIQEVKVEKSEVLRIGKTYMTKVIVFGNNLKSESDWKPHLLGGDRVPRNVKAIEMASNPHRCIQLTFDAPKEGVPQEYKVVPIPKSKIHKEGQIFKNSPVVLEYLQQDTVYSFEVSALHEKDWSKKSSSNSLTTQKKKGQTSMQDISNVSTANIDYRYAKIEGGTNITSDKGLEFGQVRDIHPTVDILGDKDVLTVDWKIPAFGNNASDYKVEKYEVKISKMHSNTNSPVIMDFVQGQQEYCIEKHDLELGQIYEISITTIYIDIDEDVEYNSSSVKVTVVTRPCQPKVTLNKISDEKLRLGWNSANGAENYKVSLYVDDSDEPLYKTIPQKQTTYERPFDEEFGFGKSYHALIEAIGSTGKINSTRTKTITVGEDHVPRELEGNITHEKVSDPSTHVYLKWKCPEKEPVSYVVTFSNGEDCDLIFFEKTECVVSSLNAGNYYIFKVIAIHKDENGIEKRSGGCLSNRIGTSPKPTQVQNVRSEPGINPCTSFVIEWDKVHVADETEKVQYRVIVMTLNEKIVEEKRTKNIREEIHKLQPNTSYFTMVAGGNSKGFGKNSAKIMFKTALGKLETVELVNSSEAPGTSLILRFTEMKGQPKRYFGRLYKGQTLSSEYTEICNDHVYNDLQANTSYRAEVYVAFDDGENGTPVKSTEAKTAPGKPEITEYGCCKKKEDFSSTDLFVKWETVDGLTYYEIRVIFERNGETEKEIIVNNGSKMTYSCEQESCQYSVQIRTKNEIFGEWSEKKLIQLGPSVLKNVKAELDNEGNKISITCKKNTQGTLQYCLQALCKGDFEGKVYTIDQKSIRDDKVSFTYFPQKNAEQYSFLLWAEMHEKLNGKKTLSNTVVSRPEKVKNVLITPADENPNMKINISWDAVERCNNYELLIQCTNSQTRECLAKVKRGICTYEYICCKPENEYTVCVRGLMKSIHGNWSNEVKSYLEPPPLQNIKAVLNIQDKNINIRCTKSMKGSLQYYMQALCNGVVEGDIVRKDHENVTGDIVEFCHSPKKFAEKYSFQLWCEKPNKKIGEKTSSNTVISRPDKVTKVCIKLDNDNPNAKIKMNWNELERCDFYEVCIQCQDSEEPECVIKVKKTRSEYICNKPGDNYVVRVRGLREHIAGDWSDNFSTCLAPSKVIWVKVNITNTNLVKVTWEPLKRAPTKYVVALYESGEKVDENSTPASNFEFENKIKPGSLCFCTVAAENDGGRGKNKKSMSHRIVSAKIQNLKSRLESGSIIYEWDHLVPSPEKYIIEWRVNESKTESSTEENSFKRLLTLGAQSYELGVAASNSAGIGQMTRLETLVPVFARIQNLNSRLESGSIIYEWEHLVPSPEKYILEWRINESTTESSTEENSFKRLLIQGAQSYELGVAGLNSAGIGQMTRLETLVPVPKLIENLHSKKEDGAIVFRWNALEKPLKEYIIQWRVNDQPIMEESTEETMFVVRFSKPACFYNLRIMASNIAGNGKISKWNTFITDPLPPRNLKVVADENAPETSFFVRYEDEVDPMKLYRVTAVAKEGDREVEIKSIETKHFCAHITGLQNGRSYFIKVQTLFCGKSSRELYYTKE